MLEINEIFGPTIQGEGKLVGSPSVFIRFGKKVSIPMLITLNCVDRVAVATF